MVKVSDFQGFTKIPRLSREMIVTEKIDGTNAQIVISDDGESIQAGSRRRFITPQDDNYGFARWVEENKDELFKLGPGSHYGEWWGSGIQRKYGLSEKRFSLFNTTRWAEWKPACCYLVPILYQGVFDTCAIDVCLNRLKHNGSEAAPGFMQPEGVVIFHTAGKCFFKKTIDRDAEPKGKTTKHVR